MKWGGPPTAGKLNAGVEGPGRGLPTIGRLNDGSGGLGVCEDSLLDSKVTCSSEEAYKVKTVLS